MDLTHIFKAAVMTAKVRQQKQKSAEQSQPNQQLQQRQQKPTITATNKRTTSPVGGAQRDEFAREAKEICMKITALRDVLLENRAAYMRIGQHLKNAAHMTDEQRDLIDRESEKFFNFYTQQLAQMRGNTKASTAKNRVKRKPQELAHMDGVLALLQEYLGSVQQIHQQLKKYRVQYELETYRLTKLAADKSKIPVRLGGEGQDKVARGRGSNKRRGRATDEDVSDEEEDEVSDEDDAVSGTQSSELESDDYGQKEDEGNNNNSQRILSGQDHNRRLRAKAIEPDHHQLRQRKGQNPSAPALRHMSTSSSASLGADSSVSKTSLAQISQKVAVDEDIQKSQQLVDEETKLSPEDIQMFEQENKYLYQELQGLTQEVEEIGKNVVEIAQLQDIFTEKVSMQQNNIERIANAVVGATENVRDANEQIRQAIQRNAGLRVWSLFFMLVMSFALLFLDWYYD